eukprot:snap_masked-scaffold_48-processed-gene-1.52-mRNA-1 protein AED:1.00 eAED:1.00 QI:0/0/0/0/1/1/2/0/64
MKRKVMSAFRMSKVGLVIAAIMGAFGDCNEEYENCSSRSSSGRGSSSGGRRGLIGFVVDSVLER